MTSKTDILIIAQGQVSDDDTGELPVNECEHCGMA